MCLIFHSRSCDHASKDLEEVQKSCVYSKLNYYLMFAKLVFLKAS